MTGVTVLGFLAWFCTGGVVIDFLNGSVSGFLPVIDCLAGSFLAITVFGVVAGLVAGLVNGRVFCFFGAAGF